MEEWADTRPEFEELERRHPNFRFWPTVTRLEPSWQGRTGRVQQHLADAIGDSGVGQGLALVNLRPPVRRRAPGMVDTVSRSKRRKESSARPGNLWLHARLLARAEWDRPQHATRLASRGHARNPPCPYPTQRVRHQRKPIHRLCYLNAEGGLFWLFASNGRTRPEVNRHLIA